MKFKWKLAEFYKKEKLVESWLLTVDIKPWWVNLYLKKLFPKSTSYLHSPVALLAFNTELQGPISGWVSVFDHRGYWIGNADKNNTGLNGARLKTSLSKISSTKKYLCVVITLFSFGVILGDSLNNWKIIVTRHFFYN